MKRLIKILILTVLVGSLTIQADPFKIWSWTDPTEYTNGQTIPAGDLTTRTLKCGTTTGGPYPNETVFISQSSPSNEDMAFAVGGIPGNYYCVSTVWSIQYLVESGNSNEQLFTVAPGALGFVPQPPVLALQ